MKIIDHIIYPFIFLLILLYQPAQAFQQENYPNKPNNPGARWGHVFIYNPVQDQVLLFGGAPERGTFLNDTWLWKANKWKKMEANGPTPTARGFCAVAYHEDRNTILLHGGRGLEGVTYYDTWEWDGSNWEQLESNSDYKADHHQMVYVASQKIILAFGGWNGANVSGDTWIWSGEWAKSEKVSPPQRASFAMTYDKISEKVKLFGGLWINGQYADLWEWSNGEWNAVGGPYDNSSLDHHAMIIDEKSGRAIIFGGKNYRYQPQKNTLTVEGNQVRILTSEGPSGRHSLGFTNDSKSKLGYLYGGKELQDNKQVALDDFWQWDGEKWERIN